MSRAHPSAQVDPTIVSVLDRARLVHADNLATLDLPSGQTRTWAETGDRVDRVARS